MAFSELINRLIPQGAVMAGQRPQTILADDTAPAGGSAPGYYDTSRTGNLLRQIQVMQAQEKMKEEEQLKKNQNRLNYYKTLRAAGYDPKKAYEATINRDFPKEEGGVTPEETVKEAQAGYYKSRTIGAKQKSVLHAEIQDKVARGVPLTAGEKRLYDEVIRKYGNKSSLSDVLANKNAQPAAAAAAGGGDEIKKEDYVPMVSPIGQKKLVPRANVEKAKAKGWKLR